MERLSLMQAIEEAIRAQKSLEEACHVENMEDADNATCEMAYALNQICRSVGLDYNTLRRTAR